MKRTILMLFAAFTLGTTLNAQTAKSNDKAQQRVNRTELLTKRVNRLADEMKLDDKTQAWFVPLYMEYQKELLQIYHPADAKNKLVKRNSVSSLTDEESLNLIENTFKMEEQKVSLQRKYYEKFKKNLTPQQLVSIFYRSPLGNHQKCDRKRKKGNKAEMVKRFKEQQNKNQKRNQK